MKVKILLLYLMLIAVFFALCMGEEYELHSWNMREVEPMECMEGTGPGSEDMYFVRSAPVSAAEFPINIYGYKDSTIVSDYGLLSTYLKSGEDTLGLLSVQNRTLRLSPVADAAPVFLRGLSLPQRLEFDAYAEALGRDSLEIRMEAGVVPKGRCTLVIDSDALTSLSVVDTYISTYMPDSISGGVVWRRETRDLYGNERIFPVAREITDYFSVGEDTVASPTVTLLASQETVEDMVREDSEIRRAPGVPPRWVPSAPRRPHTFPTPHWDHCYSGQPLTVSYSEGSVAYTLSNTYTYLNCVLKESQLTLNGTSHLLSRNGYDGLGRLNKIERGLQGGTSGFAYDLMGRLISFAHDRGFTQTLHYADGPGTPRYDGLVSAMSWKTVPGENRLRGYRYAYDGLGRLTDAVYGENTTLESNPNRYTERVLDDALPVTRYATADFADLTDRSTEYAYDECGAMISDSNQSILSISYDNTGNPRLTQFVSGHQVEYVYTPSGQKVREIHRSPRGLVTGGTTLPAPHEMFADTTDYIGPAIYRGGKPAMVRYAGGYASLSKSGTKYVPAFHHYITDYLGNNRAVVRASDGAFVQVTHYYPWGSVYGDMGTGASVQPYKY